METLAEVEEALRHASSVPDDQRGVAWQRFVDSLLDKRTRLAGTDAHKRETRVVRFSEAR